MKSTHKKSFQFATALASVMAVLAFQSELSGCGISGGNAVVHCELSGGFETVDDYQLDALHHSYPGALAADASGNLYVSGVGAASDGTSFWIIRKSADQGDTWTTVQSYQRQAGQSSGTGFHGVTVDSDGAIYAASETVESGTTYYTVRRSTDQGTTWEQVDSYVESGETFASGGAAFAHSSGRLFTGGQATVTGGVKNWIVRKSDSGAASSWSESDSFGTNGGNNARDFAEDPSGRIYAAGFTEDGSGFNHWVLRRSADRGTSWETVDDFRQATDKDAQAQGVGVDSTGSIYVGGWSDDAEGSKWTVQKSTSGDYGTWSVVDEYQEGAGQNGSIASLHVDAGDRIWTAGFLALPSTVRQFAIRMSSNGSTWSTVDTFNLTSAQSSEATQIRTDPKGNIYAVGYSTDTSTFRHWIVRRQLCK